MSRHSQRRMRRQWCRGLTDGILMQTVPLRYSWTGRPRFAAPGIMEDRLPLNADIPEHLVEDDVGVWVTFGVPPGHYLFGKFVPVDHAASRV